MSESPSWLNEENVATAAKVAKNPAVQKFATNPVVQNAAKEAAKESILGSKASSSSAGVGTSEPSWAKTNSLASKDVESGAPIAVNGTAVGSSSPPPLELDKETEDAIKKHHLALRVLYMIASILLGCAAGVYLARSSNVTAYQMSGGSTVAGGATDTSSSTSGSVTTQVTKQDIGLTFFALYVIFFSLMICIFEVGLSACSRVIAINFGFMYNIAARFIFMLYVGFMCFGFGPFGIAAMCFLYCVGLYHVAVTCKYPKFEQYVRTKDYLASRGAR